MSQIVRETVRVESEEPNVFVDVWFYAPANIPKPYPVVVAGHGLTLLKHAGLGTFGERWARDARFASLIFDYRGFGASDGTPQNVVSLENQYADYRAVVKWARSKPEIFRSDKIVVMGGAMGGLNIARLAIEEVGLAGAMAHCPVLDGYATLVAMPFNLKLIALAAVDWLRGRLGLSPLFIKAVGKQDEFAFLNTPSSYSGFTHMYAGSPTPFEEVPNVLAPRLAFEVMSCRFGLQLTDAKCPCKVF